VPISLSYTILPPRSPLSLSLTRSLWRRSKLMRVVQANLDDGSRVIGLRVEVSVSPSLCLSLCLPHCVSLTMSPSLCLPHCVSLTMSLSLCLPHCVSHCASPGQPPAHPHARVPHGGGGRGAQGEFLPLPVLPYR
jgi:hypothetical protein